jgi:hypothetical protein
MTLSVPQYQQSTLYTCLPACGRMVLAFRGHYHTEAELARAFGTVPLLGTLPENVVSGLDLCDMLAAYVGCAFRESCKQTLGMSRRPAPFPEC